MSARKSEFGQQYTYSPFTICNLLFSCRKIKNACSRSGLTVSVTQKLKKRQRPEKRERCQNHGKDPNATKSISKTSLLTLQMKAGQDRLVAMGRKWVSLRELNATE